MKLKCPKCGKQLEETPNREKFKDSYDWYNCISCEITWKIHRMVAFYEAKKRIVR